MSHISHLLTGRSVNIECPAAVCNFALFRFTLEFIHNLTMSRQYINSILITTFSLLTCMSLAFESPIAGSVADLGKRQNVVQGWALVEQPCPQGTGTCERASCCPLNSYCDLTDFSTSNVCCPTCTSVNVDNVLRNPGSFMYADQPCGYNVTQDSRCALDSWSMFETSEKPICCMPGHIGVQPTDGASYGTCTTSGAALPADAIATTVGVDLQLTIQHMTDHSSIS